MAPYSAAGPVGAAGLAFLALATAVSAVAGASAAMRRRFADHGRWMLRCYLLLCSAVVLRLMGGLATVVGITAPWFDTLAAWACWLSPLGAFEIAERAGRRTGHSPSRSVQPRARSNPARTEAKSEWRMHPSSMSASPAA